VVRTLGGGIVVVGGIVVAGGIVGGGAGPITG
jgi:hypothetical protein